MGNHALRFSGALLLLGARLLLLALLGAPFPALAATELEDTLGPAVPMDKVQGGRLLFEGGKPGMLYPAPTVNTDVRMRVAGMVARVTVSQSFTNPTREWLNGVYVFPLPDTAAVDHMRLLVGERVIEGRIEKRAEAKRIYAAARRAGKKASLVEQERPNIFTNSVANIGPGETVRVSIEYQQTVHYEQGVFSLRFPMTVGVRYIPGSPEVEHVQGTGWAYDTDVVPDASRITPPVAEPGRGHGNPVSITADLQPGFALAGVHSTYHRIDLQQLGAEHYQVRLAAGTVPANRDFELTWRVAAGRAPRAALFTQRMDGDTYGLLMLVPPETGWAEQRSLPRELIYVIDTSGSMAGTSIEQAKGALLDGLDRLRPGDAFNVIEFNSYTRMLSPRVLPASAGNIAMAKAFVQSLRANGGTEMARALTAALDGSRDPSRVRQVVFVTDGQVGNERQLFDIIGKRLGDSRLFTVGIGSAPNSYFMREAAAAGRGTFTWIGATQEVARKMQELFARIEHPVLTGIGIEWAGAGEVDYQPQPIGDLYLHEPLIVSFRRKGGDGAITVRGNVDGAPWRAKLPAGSGARATGLDVLWARRKIESLERGLSRGAKREEVAAEVIRLGLEHHIVTAHTSLVAVDVTPTRPAGASSRDAAVVTEKPAGWTMPLPQARLPQTATPARLELVTGLVLALLASLFAFAGRRRRA